MWFIVFKPCVCDFGWNGDSGLSGGELQLRQVPIQVTMLKYRGFLSSPSFS